MHVVTTAVAGVLIVSLGIGTGIALGRPRSCRRPRARACPRRSCQYCHTEAVPKKETFKPEGCTNDRGRVALRGHAGPQAERATTSETEGLPRRKGAEVIGAGVALLGVAESLRGERRAGSRAARGMDRDDAGQWTQGLGMALALVGLVILVLAWRGLRRGGERPGGGRHALRRPHPAAAHPHVHRLCARVPADGDRFESSAEAAT